MVVWYALGREWPWISGSLNKPLSCDFFGNSNRGFHYSRNSVLKYNFVKLCVWLSNSNRIACG